MSFTDLFWVFIVFTTVLPWFQRRLLEAARLRAIRDLERLRGSRVITLIHRQESMALLGFAQLLAQHLLEGLGCDSAEAVRVHLGGDEIADLGIRLLLPGFQQTHLERRLGHDANDLLLQKGGPALLGVDVYGHFARRAHEFLVGHGQGVFDLPQKLVERNISLRRNLIELLQYVHAGPFTTFAKKKGGF